MMTLRRLACALAVAVAVGVVVPAAVQAKVIDRVGVGTFNGRPTAPELCDPGQFDCGFVTVTFDPTDENVKQLKLKGLSIRYFDEGGSNVIFEDFLDDVELDQVTSSTTFLNPIPLTAAFANIVASRLSFVPPARGSFLTLPVLFGLDESTGLIEFQPEEEPPPSVPEPMLLALVGLGTLLAGRRARRR
jgi:MYXO-CTERM domain-containing protein